MNKSELKKYVILLIAITAVFIFFWCEPIFRFLDGFSFVNIALRRVPVTANPVGLAGNYLDSSSVTISYAIMYIFALNFLFMTDNPAYIVRLKSRKFYVNKHITDTLIFTLIFVFILEMVNLTGTAIVLGIGEVIQSKLIIYSLINFVVMFLYYFRIGILLFIMIVIVSKKYAPFVTAAVLLLESAGSAFLPVLDSLWLPSKDATYILSLLSGNIREIDILPAIIRGLIMDAAIILFAYYLFLKKDIIVKKENS